MHPLTNCSLLLVQLAQRTLVDSRFITRPHSAVSAQWFDARWSLAGRALCRRPLTSGITICVQKQGFPPYCLDSCFEDFNESTRRQRRKLSEPATFRSLQINTPLFRYSRHFTAVTVSARVGVAGLAATRYPDLICLKAFGTHKSITPLACIDWGEQWHRLPRSKW